MLSKRNFERKKRKYSTAADSDSRPTELKPRGLTTKSDAHA